MFYNVYLYDPKCKAIDSMWTYEVFSRSLFGVIGAFIGQG